MRRGLPTQEDLGSHLRAPAVSSRVGLWLGICFAVAFLTGLVSHWGQLPDPVIGFPARPRWGYRVTQGLHVTAGTAAVPLLLVKLWSVYHRLLARPPRAGWALVRHLAERASILALVAGAVFQLVTGLANATQWYPWAFSFRSTHYAVAWLVVGALLLHVAVQLPTVRAALGRGVDVDPRDAPGRRPPAGLSRRGLLRSTWLGSEAAVLLTAGGSVPWLREVSVFAVTTGEGPGGVPVNTTAREAQVVAPALATGFRLVVSHGDREVSLTREELLALPQDEVELPIACVEGWSASGRWSGVRLRRLLDHVGAPPGRSLRVDSLQERGPFRSTVLPAHFADDELTLLALGLAGEPLALDHGYPCRLIAPNRPGVLQTKWVSRIEVR